jgi:predicted dehydrogenase
MPDQTVRLASIGLGWWGSTLAAATAAAEDAVLETCFARSEEARNAFAEKHGCRAAASMDEIWSDPEIDGVLIATPHSTHAELIEEAASAGKHVFVEKPMTLDAASAKKAIEAASSAGIVLQVGHNKRRQAGNRFIREQVNDGSLGQLQHIETNISVPVAFKPDLPQWRQTREELPAGGMTPLGVHMLDTIHYLGGDVKRVYAMSRRVSELLDVDDVTTILFELESGAGAYLATLMAVPNVTTVAAFGTEGAAWSEADGSHAFIQKRGEPYRTWRYNSSISCFFRSFYWVSSGSTSSKTTRRHPTSNWPICPSRTACSRPRSGRWPSTRYTGGCFGSRAATPLPW